MAPTFKKRKFNWKTRQKQNSKSKNSSRYETRNKKSEKWWVSSIKPNQTQKNEIYKKSVMCNMRETEFTNVTIQQEEDSELILNHQQLPKSTSKVKTVVELKKLISTNLN